METFEQLMEKLPEGSYESGWTQCCLFPISKGSMSYHKGSRFVVRQTNWRTKEERSCDGMNILDALEKFLAMNYKSGEQTNRTKILAE